jgi:hypothetical protein
MISTSKTSKKALKLTIRQMGHVGFIIPWFYHFLSCLQSLLTRSRNRRSIAINSKCIKDLELMQSILKKAKEGIHMNLLTFRSPGRIYYSDSFPAGLGGYSNQRHAWHFKVMDNLQFRVTNNLLKLLAAMIIPWIKYYQRQTQTRRLSIVNDQQHNSQRVDEEIQL